jgi:hypothetical protein
MLNKVKQRFPRLGRTAKASAKARHGCSVFRSTQNGQNGLMLRQAGANLEAAKSHMADDSWLTQQ